MNNDDHTKRDGLLDSLALFEWTVKNLPMRFFGDKILHTPCDPIAETELGTKALKKITDILVETLTKYRKHTGMGRGIAANQVGYSKRIVIVWLNDKPKVLINPRLVSSKGVGSYWESCISSGTLLIGEVHRPWAGAFEYLDIHGAVRTLEANEKETRIILHELDHLDGIVCSDRYIRGTTSFITGGEEEVFSYELRRIDI